MTPEEARKRRPCTHKACRYKASSAQVECYCKHAKEQHRIGGRHGCEECGCISFLPRAWIVGPEPEPDPDALRAEREEADRLELEVLRREAHRRSWE